ncbi:MAG: phosphate acyltransferase PlsX [Dehalococcoidia bacterium]|nr:phosphate acyltransferase PlsX [Dehalococcoidia bacterium]
MGGDLAPAVTAEGAVIAAARGVEVALVGDAAALERECARLGGRPAGVRIVHAADAIAMQEHAALELRRRRESSIAVGLELVKRGEVEAFVSLGNTGAVLALALVVLGRLAGVERPALAALLPSPAGPRLLLDAGANAEARPSHLVQFARLGAAYMRAVAGVADPGVRLLNIGEEPSKGSSLTLEVHAALAASSLRFLGNVEGRELATTDADVIVTDGFTGNVALKTIEGIVSLLSGEVRRAAMASLRGRAGGLLLRPSLRRLQRQLDYRQVGGVPLLGVDGIVIVGHGRSDGEAVANAVEAAARAAQQRMVAALTAAVEAADAPPSRERARGGG